MGYGRLDLSKVQGTGLKYRMCFFCPESRLTTSGAQHAPTKSALDRIKCLGKSSNVFIIKATPQTPSQPHSEVDAEEPI